MAQTGETNNRVMVRAIARHADVFNSMPASVERFREKLDTVESACEAAGRDFSTLGLSLETQILVTAPTPKSIGASNGSIGYGPPSAATKIFSPR